MVEASLRSNRRRRLFPFRKTSSVAIVGILLLVVGVICWTASYAGIVLALHRFDGATLPYASASADRLGRAAADAAIKDGTASADDEEGTAAAATPVVGTYALLGPSHDIETVYAIPPAATAGPPIALLLHACTHSALKFFSHTPDVCDGCVGLSEELAISRTLLRRGYAVLAVTSSDRKGGCWGGPKDVCRVRTALDEFRDTIINNNALRQKSIPDHELLGVVAVGASSGGRFAAQIAADGTADAAIVMVMGLGESLRSRLIGVGSDRGVPPPPIYLAPMVRDKRTAGAVRKDYEFMRRVARTASTLAGNGGGGGDSGGGYPVVLDETTCVPLAVTASYLHTRTPSLGLFEARAIVDALTGAGHIDRTTGLLLKDPTRSNWRDVLRQECGGSGEKEGGSRGSKSSGGGGCLRNQPLGPGKSPLAKSLHRAWAFHEYCSEVVAPALEYIERKWK